MLRTNHVEARRIADETTDDPAIPALSETSEGADLSTPNLDSGSTDGTNNNN